MVPKTDPAAEYQDRTTRRGEQVLPLADEYLINVITRGYARAAYPRSLKIMGYPSKNMIEREQDLVPPTNSLLFPLKTEKHVE